jgi:hypothetical protein
MVIQRGVKSRSSSSFFLKGSKAQVTIFIIIGIVLLFTFAGVLYVTKTVKTDTLVTQSGSIIQDVPTQFRSVVLLTEDCLSEVSEKGLKVLGQQGGYIYPELVGSGTYEIDNPTDSDGLDLGATKIPYWHYNVEANKNLGIKYATLMPELYASEDGVMSIESQLARFVKEQLSTCLDYSSFQEQGIDVLTGEIEFVEVQIAENYVDFSLDMNVEASQGGSSEDFDRFFVRIPLRLKHYYEVAQRITESQQTYYFLESQFLSLLGAFASIPDSPLPPTNAVTFEVSGTKLWTTDDIKSKVTKMISSHVALLQVNGARNVQYYDYPVADLSNLHQQNFNNNIVTNIDNIDNVEVRFDYFGWEPYFDVNDLDGVVKSEDVLVQKWFLPPLGIQRYKTTYDVSYPVIVSIDDPFALDNDGYQFMIALEANVRNNDRVVDNQVIPGPITSFAESMACDGNKRSSEIINTKIVDSFTNEPLELVRIGYTIPDQAECTMGFTDNDGEHESTYPEVYGGHLNLIKEDYLTGFYPIDTYNSPGGNIIGHAIADFSKPVLELHRFKPINVSFKKKNLGKCIIPVGCPDENCIELERHCFFESGNGLFGLPDHMKRIEVNYSSTKFNDYYFLNSEVDLRETEEVIVTLTRVADVNGDLLGPEHVTPIFVQGSDKTEVDLVPGIYKVDGMLTLHEEVIIPEEQRSIKYTIIVVTEEIEFNIDETKMDSYMSGQLKWDNDETYFTITEDDLYTSDELTFIIPSQDILTVPGKITLDSGFEVNGRIIEDLLIIPFMANVSQIKRSSLEPKWS